ncbi:hypothetical protein N7493_009600 [Penicillium malachiteum]|uniref:Uncharacterized protein n=1 Tax=Penicillium malachiteum TaxID=1324776 RepID=A0AAD6HET7_9EURO|nr:hypothetical protein N7493_009600 [Penicillium malachiteum]
MCWSYATVSKSWEATAAIRRSHAIVSKSLKRWEFCRDFIIYVIVSAGFSDYDYCDSTISCYCLKEFGSAAAVMCWSYAIVSKSFTSTATIDDLMLLSQRVSSATAAIDHLMILLEEFGNDTEVISLLRVEACVAKLLLHFMPTFEVNASGRGRIERP